MIKSISSRRLLVSPLLSSSHLATDSMYQFVIAYSVIAIWMFGWLTGTFGLEPAFFVSALFFVPAVLAWRMVCARRPIKRREHGYICILTLFVLFATGYIVNGWYVAGLHRQAMFDREYHALVRYVMAQPEYKNVEISYTNVKGGLVSLQGTVSTKDSHDRLLQSLERLLWYNGSRCYDNIKYE